MNCMMLHGLGQTASSWDKTAAGMQNGFTVICPEMSDWLRGKAPCYESLYQGMEQACERLEGPIYLCGLSLGGMLALQYGIKHPEKVKALALIGVQYATPRGLMRLQNMAFRLMPRSVFQQMGWEKGDLIALCRSMISLDFSENLDKIRCPALILCGEGDRANRPAALRLSERIEKAKLDWIPQAGHEVNRDHPAALSRKLQEFFSQANRP